MKKTLWALMIALILAVCTGCASSYETETTAYLPNGRYCVQGNIMYGIDPDQPTDIISENTETKIKTVIGQVSQDLHYLSIAASENYVLMTYSATDTFGLLNKPTDTVAYIYDKNTNGFNDFGYYTNELWQYKNTVYFEGYQLNGDDQSRAIYKTDLLTNETTVLYVDKKTKGEESVRQYAIKEIKDGIIYFIKQISSPGVGVVRNELCSINTAGKKFKKYATSDSFNKIYTYANNGVDFSKCKIIEIFGVDDKYCYGRYNNMICCVPLDDIGAEPRKLSDKGTLIAVVNGQIIVGGSDFYFVINPQDDSETRHNSLMLAYKKVYSIQGENASTDKQENTGFKMPKELADLFTKTYGDIYDVYQEPLYTDGVANVYYAPNSQEILYYILADNAAEDRYFTGLAGPISILFSEKTSMTVSELQQIFGDTLQTNYSEMEGGYSIVANFDTYRISFNSVPTLEEGQVTQVQILHQQQ